MAKTFMASGQIIDLRQLQSYQIKVIDFSLALSRIPRYNGHTPPVWSVLSHTGLVYQLALKREIHLSPQQRLSLLLHDAPEGYLGDVPGPLKASGILAEYEVLENEVLERIWERFGLAWETYAADLVELYDHQAAYVEMETFFPDIPRGPGLFRIEPRYALSPIPKLAVAHLIDYGHELHRLAEAVGTPELEALFETPVLIQRFLEPLPESINVQEELDVERMRV